MEGLFIYITIVFLQIVNVGVTNALENRIDDLERIQGISQPDTRIEVRQI